MAATTNFAITVPLIFAEFLVRTVEVKYLELPFEVPHLESFLYWHESTDKDQANIWIRDMISSTYNNG